MRDERDAEEYARRRACQETPLDLLALAMQTPLSTFAVLAGLMGAERQAGTILRARPVMCAACNGNGGETRPCRTCDGWGFRQG